MSLPRGTKRIETECGYLGVYRDPDCSDQWCAGIGRKNERVHLGTFSTAEGAARAVDTYLRANGTDRHFNFPKPGELPVRKPIDDITNVRSHVSRKTADALKARAKEKQMSLSEYLRDIVIREHLDGAE